MTSIDAITTCLEPFQSRLAREVEAHAPEYKTLNDLNKSDLREFWETNKGGLKAKLCKKILNANKEANSDPQMIKNYFFLIDLINKIEVTNNGYSDQQYILIMILRDTIMKVCPSCLSQTDVTN